MVSSAVEDTGGRANREVGLGDPIWLRSSGRVEAADAIERRAERGANTTQTRYRGGRPRRWRDRGFLDRRGRPQVSSRGRRLFGKRQERPRPETIRPQATPANKPHGAQSDAFSLRLGPQS